MHHHWDIPEVLIVLGIVAGLAWAIYNRMRPQRTSK